MWSHKYALMQLCVENLTYVCMYVGVKTYQLHSIQAIHSDQQLTTQHFNGVSIDRKCVVMGKSVDLGGRRIIKKNKSVA